MKQEVEEEPLTKDEELRPTIYGVLAITIKEAKKLVGNARTSGNNLYVRASVRASAARTNIVPDNFGNPKWNQTICIPVSVPRERRHPFNMVQLDIIRFNDSSHSHHVIGTICFHLHDIIKTAPVHGAFDFFSNQLYAGELSLHLDFCYGLFGFGHGCQLKQHSELGAKAYRVESYLGYSLLPRVRPPEDRTDENGVTIIPRAVPHPEFIPFQEPVVLGYGKKIAEILSKRQEQREARRRERKRRREEAIARRKLWREEQAQLSAQLQRAAALAQQQQEQQQLRDLNPGPAPATGSAPTTTGLSSETAATEAAPPTSSLSIVIPPVSPPSASASSAAAAATAAPAATSTDPPPISSDTKSEHKGMTTLTINIPGESNPLAPSATPSPTNPPNTPQPKETKTGFSLPSTTSIPSSDIPYPDPAEIPVDIDDDYLDEDDEEEEEEDHQTTMAASSSSAAAAAAAAGSKKYGLLMQRMNRLQEMRRTLNSFESRMEKLVFLHSQLTTSSARDEAVVDHAPIPAPEVEAHLHRGFLQYCQPAAVHMPHQDKRVSLRLRGSIGGETNTRASSSAIRPMTIRRSVDETTALMDRRNSGGSLVGRRQSAGSTNGRFG